ncbi:SAM-dependent DNA methyltransferase [Flavobacterium sp. SOK18b]|uniref:class I SAM-dependent DNA methyltransferase n=1 Tax=Flavobacterium sp. SOK18b TaxID=797900 RepID=UPI001ED33AFE|nr:class I SAM-dependent DNA methyltransferase [Flavobacterium sp. SOK18b]MBB1195046.1 SAM-dependent DNA methyltransferase [Flavobacterium sp. SOK18b]
MLNSEIKNKIQLLWDRLWGGGLTNPITAIEQISYLLFMKRLEKFHPEVEEKYKWSTYNSFKGLDLKNRIVEVFTFVQNDLAKEDEPFAIEMKKAKFGIETPSLIEDTIKIIDEIFAKIEEEEKDKNQHFQDTLGDVYEYLLRATNEAGKNGQFRTPRHIIQMMAELLQPNIDNENVKICDVTSGTSGFLVGAFQYLVKESSKVIELDEENQLEKGLDGTNLTTEKKKKLIENTFFGFDIDSTMVRIGMMNMMMHGITKPKINHINTLSDEYEKLMGKNFKEQIAVDNLVNGRREAKVKHSETKDLDHSKSNTHGKDEFSYILANPPFAAKVNSKSISSNLNRIYDIKSDAKKTQSLQTELLFLERIIYMLKDEGKAIVIVPEGVLFNSGKAYKKAREILLKDCDLEAVISMPSGVFNPYTAVKTSIILFTKKQFKSKIYHTKKVWFYEMKSDGYTLDTNRKKLIGNYPLPVTISEFKTRKSKPQKDRRHKHFYVPIKEIEENKLELNINLYKEYIFEEQEYDPPTLLLEKLLTIEDEINKGLTHLKSIIE